jgi:long-subunit acyl-CoA synthetase (AMP-forming)
MFIPDGRITQEGLSEILMEIKCTAWISSQQRRISGEGQDFYLLPSLEELLSQDDDEFKQYPYNETWDQAKDDTVCIIHTSGTTGTSHQILEYIPVKRFCIT